MIRDKLEKLHHKLFWLLILLLPTQIGLHFWPEWSTVFGIRIDYLSPTVYLTDLIVVAILVSWGIEKYAANFQFSIFNFHSIYNDLILKLSNLRFDFKFQISNLFLFFLVYSLVTSLFIAENQGAALYKLVKLVEFSLLGFYISQNWKLVTGNWKFIAALTAAMVYSSLLAWFQFLNGHTLGLWILGERTFTTGTPGIALVDIAGQDFLRPYATFPHPNVLAGFLIVSTILIFNFQFTIFNEFSKIKLFKHLNFNSNSKFQISNFFFPAVFFLSLATLIITFSHSAWVAGVAAIALYAIPAFRSRIQVLARALILALVVGSVFIPAILLPENLDRPIAQRLELGQAAILMTGEHLLTGVGLNNFIVQLPKYGGNLGVSWWLQPVHNIFLLTLAETGLVGFSLLMLLLTKAVSKSLIFNPKGTSSAYFQFLTGLIVILIIGFLDHYFLTVQQGQLLSAIILGELFSQQKEV